MFMAFFVWVLNNLGMLTTSQVEGPLSRRQGVVGRRDSSATSGDKTYSLPIQAFTGAFRGQRYPLLAEIHCYFSNYQFGLQ
jgi:hypothetical protein